MLATIFRENWRQLLERFHQVEASPEPSDEQLRGVAKILLRTWRNDPDLVRVMVREVARSPQLQGQVEEIREAFATIQRIVERGQERGELRAEARPAPRELDLLRRPRGASDRLGARGCPTATRRFRVPSGRSWTSSAAVSRPPARRRSGVTARTVVILGLGAFGLAWSLTTTAAYLPPLLGQFTGSTTLIALVLAAEGPSRPRSRS